MNDEKYVRRGEIYSVIQDNVLPGEMAYSRPGLVISSDTGNRTSPVVILAMLTTRDHDIGIHYATKATGRLSYIQCEQLATVSKKRLGRLLGQLSENEMVEVDSRLDEVLDLGYVDDTPLKEKEVECEALKAQIEELRVKVVELEKANSNHADELLTRDVEIAVAKRMYEKAVGIIAAMRAEPDLPERPMGPPKKMSPPVKPPVDQTKLVDINSATFSELRGIGLSINLTLAIVNGRPYKTVEDIRGLPGMTKQAYTIFEKKICCVPVEIEEVKPTAEPQKLNVNIATAKEIREATGWAEVSCYSITGKRKRDGLYKSLDDLTVGTRISKSMLEKARHKLEV